MSNKTSCSLHISTLEDEDTTSQHRDPISQWHCTLSQQNGSSATPVRNPQNSQLWKSWKAAAMPYLNIFCCHLCGKQGKSTLPFMISGKRVGIVNVYCPNTSVMTYVCSVPVLWFCEVKTATLPSLQNSQCSLSVSAVLIVLHYLQPTFAGLRNYQNYIKFSSYHNRSSYI